MTQRKEWIFLLIVTFIVVIAWVVSDIIHARPSQPIDPKLQQALQPLDPNFDSKTLDLVNQRSEAQ